MGVKGLWKILKTVGQPVPLESLEGKTLAVDISIWLHQALKAGNESPQAHLLVLFHRICKLLFCRIRPIFVFDGVMPKLKMVALEKRRKQKSLLLKKANKSRKAYFENLAKKQAVEAQLGLTDPSENNRTSSVPIETQYLPIIESEDESENESNRRPVEYIEDYVRMRQNESSEEEGVDIEGMDIESETFASLPKEVQHEIIREKIKEKKSRHNFFRCQFPEDDMEFSKFQFARLLEKGGLTRRLDEIRRDMVQRDVTTVTDTLTLPDRLSHTANSQIEDIFARRIVSQDEGHTILWKLKPKVVQEPEDLEKSEETENIDFELVEESGNKDLIVVEDEQRASSPIGDETCATSIDAAQDESETESSQQKCPNEEAICVRQAVDYSGLETELKWNADSSEEEEEVISGNHLGSEEVSLFEHNGDLVDAVRTASYRLLTSSTLPPSSDAAVLSAVDELPQSSIDTSATLVRDDKVIAEKSGSSTESSSSDWEDVPNSPLLKGMQDEPSPSPAATSPLTVVEKEPLVHEEELRRIEADVESWRQQIQDELHALNREESRLRQQAGNPVNDRYVEDAKQLLRLFGIPFVVSPQEAEAQCAKLEELRLCDGVVTEDSDVWLFGAHRVYKNMFRQDKYVELHDSGVIDKRLGLNRSRLIAMGLLCGTDYTEGVSGVGPISAMEILAEFPSDNGYNSLQEFVNWHQQMQNNARGTSVPTRKRLLKIELPASFPSHVIYQAYASPEVDDSGDVFSWAKPDLHLLRDYVKYHFGWNQQRADELLMPVMRRLEDRSIQPKITSFFYTSPQKAPVVSESSLGVSSNRMNRVVGRLNKATREDTKATTPQSKRPSRTTKKSIEEQEPRDKGPVKRKSGSSTRKVVSKVSTKPPARRRRKALKKDGVTTVPRSESLNLSEDSEEDDIDEYIRNVDLTQFM